MTKRLQVLLDESELREVQKAARRDRVTISEWVRRRCARPGGPQPLADTGRKLDVIRRAASHAFPAPDIDQMLAEIERGYRASLRDDLRRLEHPDVPGRRAASAQGRRPAAASRRRIAAGSGS